MATPLQSVLLTDWSRRHLAGHDLDGGAVVNYTLDTTIVGTEALGRDLTQWSVGDIATLKLDPDTQLAQLRIVTPRQYIVRVHEFEIVDIAHTTAEAREDSGRHIFLKGRAENGAVYVMPMLGYTVWNSPWDLTDLRKALEKAEARQQREPGTATRLSHDIIVEKIEAEDELKSRIAQYNGIFYPGSKDAGTVLDKATSLTVTTLAVKQTGAATRAQMFTAAFVKKTKETTPKIDGYMQTKMGTAFSQPYFVIDGEKVFIRTSSL